MTNPYYDHTTYPSNGAAGSSSAMRTELDLIEAGFDKLPVLSGNASEIVAVKSDETGLEAITTTGTGSGVRATSPTLVTPVLGVATATSINKNSFTTPATSCTWTLVDGKTFTCSNTLTLAGTDGSTLNIGTGGTLGTAAYTASSSYGLVASPLSQFAATTSAQLAGVISDETGSGALVFATSPTLTTPVLGVATGTSLALGGGTALTTTNRTGTGNLVLATSPTLTTPTIGVATATSINKVAITAPATSATLTIANGKTLTASNTLTLAGTDGTTMTFPSATSTLARASGTNTFTGLQTFSTGITSTAAANSFGTSTVTDNSASTAFTITQSGAGDALNVTGPVGIGLTAGGSYKLRTGGSLTGSATKIGISSQGTFQTDVTAGFGFHTSLTSAAASFTIDAVNHFYANGTAIGSGSTVTTQYGFRAHSSLTTATNNYGFYSEIASGTNRWNFYAGGTAANYFAGTIASLGSYNSTTASAANMFIDSAGSIQRSTSSQKYKTNIETLEDWRADAFMANARPVWYRSTCEADRSDWGWYGLIAEEVAELAPQLVHWGYSGTKIETTEDVVEHEAEIVDGEVVKEAWTETIVHEREVPDTDSPLTPEGVMYDRIVPFLINKLQRLEARLVALEAQ